MAHDVLGVEREQVVLEIRARGRRGASAISASRRTMRPYSAARGFTRWFQPSRVRARQVIVPLISGVAPARSVKVSGLAPVPTSPIASAY